MTPLDRFRQAAPHLAVAVYAMEPSGPVTIELIDAAGGVTRFDGENEAAVWEKILPGLAGKEVMPSATDKGINDTRPAEVESDPPPPAAADDIFA